MNEGKVNISDKILHRERITRLFAEGSRNRFICVIAGPGYGKTIAILDYCSTLPGTVVWMHLLNIDNYTQRFWKDFTTQLIRHYPGITSALDTLGFPRTSSEFDEFLQILHQVTGRNRTCTMVFDNAEHLIGSEVMEFVNHLIEAEPEHVDFIVAGNRSLDEMHAMGEGKFFPIASKDLVFVREEVEALGHINHRTFTKRQLDEIMEKTEGWPLAIALICEKSDEELDTFSMFPKRKVIVEMFWHNYYRNYSDTLRSLLVRLSLLPFFTEDLIRVFIGDGVNIDEVLYKLPLDMFIMCDVKTGIFTFHSMYREFLRERKKGIRAQQVRQTYAAAGDWYMRHAYYREAFDCFWEIRDYTGVLLALSSLPVKAGGGENTKVALMRLNAFPEKVVRMNPRVNFYRAFMYLNNSQISHAREILLELAGRLELQLHLGGAASDGERKAPENAPKDGSATGMSDTQAYGDAAGVTDIQVYGDTADMPKDGPSGRQGEVDAGIEEKRQLLGDTYMLLSDVGFLQNTMEMFTYVEKAAGILAGAVSVRNRELHVSGNHSVFFLCDFTAGERKKMQERIFTYAGYAEKITGGSGYGLELLFNAEAEYYSGHMDAAEEYAIRTAAKANVESQYDIVCNALLILLRIAVYRGNREVAYAMKDEIQSYLEDYRVYGLRDIYEVANAWLGLIFDRTEELPAWVRDKSSTYKRRPFAGRERLLHVAFLLKEDRDYEAYAALLEFEQMFEERGMFILRIYDYIYKSIYYLKNNQRRKSAETLYKAYRMTYKNHMNVIFEEFGEGMQKLITCAQRQDEIPFDAGWLERIKNGAEGMEKRLSAMRKSGTVKANLLRDGVSLTGREKEVLRLLSEGISRNEIAALLGITLNGVKKHISNIYTKLGAMNRTEAIRIAIANGLLKM